MRLVLLALAAWLLAGPARAQNCDTAHEVAQGQTIYSLARNYYGDAQLWPEIFYGNQPLLTDRDLELRAGDVVFIPCLAPAGAVRGDTVSYIGSAGNSPLAGVPWSGNGIVPSLLAEALAASPDPLVLIREESGQAGDIALGRRPESCGPEPGLCGGKLYSEPVLSLPLLLFSPVDTDASEADAMDCAGLDRAAADCFRMLAAGQVPAVVSDAVRGGAWVSWLGLEGRVVAAEHPVGTLTLHAVIDRNNWRGTTLLYRINAGLEALRESGRYDAVLSRHLSEFRARFGTR